MTTKRPIEVVTASQACAEAWLKRDAMIEAGDKEGVRAMDLTCAILDERYQTIYREWQILGGTSNIESIALPLPAEHYEGNFADAWCFKDEAVDIGLNDDRPYKPANFDWDDGLDDAIIGSLP